MVFISTKSHFWGPLITDSTEVTWTSSQVSWLQLWHEICLWLLQLTYHLYSISHNLMLYNIGICVVFASQQSQIYLLLGSQPCHLRGGTHYFGRRRLYIFCNPQTWHLPYRYSSFRIFERSTIHNIHYFCWHGILSHQH